MGSTGSLATCLWAGLAAHGAHLSVVRERKPHGLALRSGYAGVELPEGQGSESPRAALELTWRYVFPATRPSIDPRSGAYRRHHIYEDSE